MARFFKKRTQIKGESPGSIIFVGQKKVEQVVGSMMDYNGETFSETALETLPPREMLEAKDSRTWLDFEGLHDQQYMQRIQQTYVIHPLIMEDVVNTGQRPKVEDIEGQLFTTLKMLSFDEKTRHVQSEQCGFVLGTNYLLSFKEQPGDVFDAVRNRIRKSIGRIRNSGSDYLLYALLDSIVDNYVFLIEDLGQRIEDLELNVLADRANNTVIQEINNYKQELNFLSKVIRPVRELVQNLNRSENPLITKKTRPFLLDLQGIVTHAIETIDSYRDMLSDLLSIHNSQTNNRLNDIMRVLTIFSAVFIPLTFLAGIYGMNFEYMPELGWRMSYFTLLGFMAVVATGMLLFFRGKKWL